MFLNGRKGAGRDSGGARMDLWRPCCPEFGLGWVGMGMRCVRVFGYLWDRISLMRLRVPRFVVLRVCVSGCMDKSPPYLL